MKKTLRSFLAVVLALAILSSFSVCFAAIEKEHLDYGSYVLLGDSIACGWNDVDQVNTSFKDVDYSYGHIVAEKVGAKYYPEACIGFRTIDLRYILEDDYVAPDDYLFYSVDDKEALEKRIPAIREEIANAGLITVNVGGNDWGSVLGWTLFDLMDESEVKNEAFLAEAEKYLEESGADRDTVENLLEIAVLTGCAEQLAQKIPEALNRGITNYFGNWNILIEDIYAYNPDVTLVVIGMFDTSLQDPDGRTDTKNEESEGGFDIQDFATKLEIGNAISLVANNPFIEGAKKYGYIYVEPKNVLCELQHPSVNGHAQIAEAILAALPYANFPYQIDVKRGDANYAAIEYMWINNIIPGTGENEFGVNKILTLGQLENAIAALNGAEGTGTSTEPAMRIDIITQLLNANPNATFMQKIKTFGLMIPFFINNFRFNFLGDVRKGEAAELIYDFVAINY